MDGPGGYVDGSTAVVTAAADSGYPSRIPASAKFVEVAARVNGADDWIVLPTGIPPGHEIIGYSVVGHEIRTEAGSNIKINNVDADGSAEAAITATWNWRATYLGSTGWILSTRTNAGAAGSTLTPD